MNGGNFLVYKSSAGSGKTFTLVKEYLKHCLLTSDPKRFRYILAITFTNKAAAEMKERVIESLKLLSTENAQSEAFFQILKEETRLSENTIKNRLERILGAMLHNYSDISISTIDSFIHRLIRSFSRDLRVRSDFEITLDTDRFLGEAIDNLIQQVGENDLITQNLEEFIIQKANDDKNWNINRDLFLFAQKTLDEEATFHLEKFKENASQILNDRKKKAYVFIINFEKKVKNIGDAVLSCIQSNGINTSAFAGGDRSGIHRFFHHWSKVNVKSLFPTATVQKNMSEEKWFSAKATDYDKAAIESVQAKISSWYTEAHEILEKDYKEYIVQKLILKNLYAFVLLKEIQDSIKALKAEENVLLIGDFNKMISNIVLNEPTPFIYERIGNRYFNIMIDEFQDTSALQWQNFLPLLDESLGKGNKNLLVGDGKQSIYRFRNGKVEQFMHLPYLMEKENEVVRQRESGLVRNYEQKLLDTNYRSKEEVVRFNNQFFEQSKVLLSEDYQAVFKDHEQKVKSGNNGGYVELKLFETKDQHIYQELQIKQITQQIADLLERGYAKKDIAILVARKSKAEIIANALIDKGISVTSSESLLVHRNPRVHFINAFLQYLIDPENPNASLSIFKFLHQHLSEKGEDFSELLIRYTVTQKARSSVFFNVKKYLHDLGIEIGYELKNTSVYEIVEELIRLFKLNEHSNIYLQAYLNNVHHFSVSRGSSMVEFLQWWDEQKEKLFVTIPEQTDAIKIMTIHKSKGLEFKAVLVPFVDWQIKPGKDNLWLNINDPELPVAFVPTQSLLQKTDYQADYEKEIQKTLLDTINLLYVAFTRAGQELFIYSRYAKRKSTFSHVGQIVTEVLEKMKTVDQSVSFGTPFILSKVSESKGEKSDFGKKLVSNPWREKIRVSLQAPKFWEMEHLETAKQYGQLVHSILANINYYEDVDRVLSDFFTKGIITASQVEEISAMLSKLFSNDEIMSWFSEENKALNETELLDENGTSFRPDRVVYSKENTIIIDYKTGTPDVKHQRQILKYGELLEKLGFENVLLKILYLQTGEVLTVNN